MVLGIPANLLILLIAHYMKNNNSFYSWFMYNITMCDLVILIYTTVKLMYIRFGEDFTGWLPNDWFGSLICKGMISIKIDQSLSFLIYICYFIFCWNLRSILGSKPGLYDRFLHYYCNNELWTIFQYNGIHWNHVPMQFSNQENCKHIHLDSSLDNRNMSLNANSYQFSYYSSPRADSM